MSESKAMRWVLAILSVVTAVCMPMFFYYAGKDLLEYACVFALINMSFFWKLYLGAKRYFKQQECELIAPSGNGLLSYALFRFY